MNICGLSPSKEASAGEGLAWYVANCKPRQESIAAENLRRQGFEAYFPRMKARQRRRGAWLESIQPLFPRYLFVHVDPSCRNIAPIRSTRGVVGLVRLGGQLAKVPDSVLATIKARSEPESGLHDDPQRIFTAGERVSVCEGPLAGLEGIFTSPDGEQRALVMLEMLGKVNRLRIPLDWIAKAA